jgi:ketosteroid isomerase-like protein
MSQETVELAREVMATLSRGDFERLLTLAHPEAEWHSFFAELGEGGVYRGIEGMQEYVNDLSDAWDIVRADIDDALGVEDVAVLVGRIHFRGRGSGLETALPAGWMFKFRDGKVILFRAFRDPAQALEALGRR